MTLARATVTEQMAQLLRDIHASMLEKWVSLFFPTFSVLTELIFGFFLLFFCFCAAPPKCRTSTRRSSTTSATSFRRWTRRTSSWRPSAATRRARTRSRRSRRGNSIVVHSALVGGPSVSFHVVFFSFRRDDGGEPGAPAMGAKSLCIPLEQPRQLEADTACIYPGCCNKPKFYCLFGRSY